MTARPTARTAFFVGYLRMPGALALFLWGLLPLLAGGIFGAAMALAIDDRAPSPAGSLTGGVTLTGIVALHPYPMLRLPPDPDHPEPRTVLVIQPGKNGAQGRLAGLDGATVTAQGLLYEREGQQLFELAGGAAAVQTTEPLGAFTPEPAEALGTHSLAGQIVDPKCFLGAMRPGEGKPHMMCGNRCLFGGIPPMLAVRDPEGALTMVMLLGPEGAATVAPFEAWTSLPVRLTGAVSALDGLLVMRVAADGLVGL